MDFDRASILSSEYAHLSDNQKRNYLSKSLDNLDQIASDSLKINYLFEIASEYYYLKDNTESLQASKQILELAKKNYDSLSMGRALYYMGDCYENYEKDSAYYYYKESEKIFRYINNDEKVAKALYNKAYLLFTEGNFAESEVEVIKALQKLQRSEKYFFIYRCYYLQACNHTELEEYDNALKYLKLAQESLEEAKKTMTDIDSYDENMVLSTIAVCNIYDKKEEYSKAIVPLKTLLTTQFKIKKPALYATVLGNLAYSQMKMGNYKSAQKDFAESIALAKFNNDVKGYLFKIINYGEFHLLTTDTTKAIYYFKEALPLARKLKLGNEVLKSLKFLSVSDIKNASQYKDSYVRVSDSMVKHQRLNSEKFSRIEYETSKIENSNKILSSNNLLLALGLVGSVLIFLIILLIRNSWARKKELLLIQQKEIANDELFNLIKEFQVGIVQAREEEQDRISKELHDGVVNRIYSIRMVLEILNEKSDLITKEKRISYLRELNKVESEIRDLSHDLNVAERFSSNDFNFLLHSLINSKNGFTYTKFVLTVGENIDWKAYSSVIKVNLYRVLQELLLNVNKHAEAKKCSVEITSNDEYLKIIVMDNGVGYDVTKSSTGIGTKNIVSRLKLIGANLVIESDKLNGTKFIITI